jgi:tRNA-uridine 2-sulfurtransferase
MSKRALVAMSGGVDSSVAALLVQRAGYEAVGMTALLFGDASASGPCCGKEGASSAKLVCDKLGMEHHWVDMAELFERQVIERFLDAYEGGRTPNPCSDCNRFIKFDAFFETADKLSCAVLATGHYARIEGGVARTAASAFSSPVARASLPSSGWPPGTAAPLRDWRTGPSAPPMNWQGVALPLLQSAVDAGKDQSYFLACIAPEKLARIHFPLGGLTKPEVRALAEEAGLPTAQRKESQDVCFMANGAGIAELLGWHRGRAPQPGRIVDDAGRDLGEHRGVAHYTIGQRRGLGLGGGTEGLSVQSLDAATNTVVVAAPERYPITALRLTDFTDMAPGLWRPGGQVALRSRYRQQPWLGCVSEAGGGRAVVAPAQPIYSAARGQWCVGYDGDTVLFGGIIEGVEYGEHNRRPW